MNKKVETKDLFDRIPDYIRPLLEQSRYPWEILPKIKAYIENLVQAEPTRFTELAPGVYVGEKVTIHPSAVILPPAVIGDECEIRPNAYIRGSVITGARCVIGNSTELKNCVLLDGVQVPHYNYVGDSVLGNRAHMGAGAVCSNFKAAGNEVVVHGEREYPTGLTKLGGILGDGADVGCGCVLNPGTVIGKNTAVYPLNALRGVFPAECIVKSQENIVERRK